MKNADLFKATFGLYATEVWSMKEPIFLLWLNSSTDSSTGSSTDCVSRQYLVKKAVSWDKHFADGIRYVALTDILNAPSVKPTVAKMETVEDCVSRQAVLNYIRDNYRRWFINDDTFTQCVNGIKDIVPVTPTPRIGRWIATEDGFECSKCGCISRSRANLCQYCGAKMEVDG